MPLPDKNSETGLVEVPLGVGFLPSVGRRLRWIVAYESRAEKWRTRRSEALSGLGRVHSVTGIQKTYSFSAHPLGTLRFNLRKSAKRDVALEWDPSGTSGYLVKCVSIWREPETQ